MVAQRAPSFTSISIGIKRPKNGKSSSVHHTTTDTVHTTHSMPTERNRIIPFTQDTYTLPNWNGYSWTSLSRALSYFFLHFSSPNNIRRVVSFETNDRISILHANTPHTKKKMDPLECDKYANAEKKKSCISFCLCIRNSPFSTAILSLLWSMCCRNVRVTNFFVALFWVVHFFPSGLIRIHRKNINLWMRKSDQEEEANFMCLCICFVAYSRVLL